MRRFAEYLNLQGLSVNTCAAYYRSIMLMSVFCEDDPLQLSDEQLRKYFVYVKCQKKWSPKTIRGAVASGKHFYESMLKRKCSILNEIRARDTESLPEVLNVDEIRRIFRCFDLRRYRTPLLLCYASGLRISECLHVGVDDIKGTDNKLLVRKGKGGKDRYTILSTPMYRELKRYWLQHQNKRWLFPEVNRGSSDSEDVCKRMQSAKYAMGTAGPMNAMTKAVKSAGVTRKATAHTLRHSFATHLIEEGVSSAQIQEYMGHASPETTAIYLHLTPVCHQKALTCIDNLVDAIL